MGIFTLEEMREEVSENLGGRVQSNRRIDRWINSALADVVNRIKPQELRLCANLLTEEGIRAYEWQVKEQGIISVVSPSTKYRLLYRAEENFSLNDRSRLDDPCEWSRTGGHLLLWPTPRRELSLLITYNALHDRLVSDEATTILNPALDQAIIIGATINGLLFLGESERVQIFTEKFEYVLRSRNWVRDETTEGFGVEVVTSREDLTRMRR